MNIVVCVKHIPDPNVPPEMDGDRLKREGVQGVLDPGDEFGVEAGLQLKEKNGGEVTLVSMGPAAAREAVTRGLSMGADKGHPDLRRRARRSRRAGNGTRARRGDQAQRVRSGYRRGRVDRRLHRHDGRNACRVPRRAAGDVREEPRERRRYDCEGRPPDRDRLPRGRELPAGRHDGDRRCQRASLRIVQGHHGCEEEAAGGAVARRPRIVG